MRPMNSTEYHSWAGFSTSELIFADTSFVWEGFCALSYSAGLARLGIFSSSLGKHQTKLRNITTSEAWKSDNKRNGLSSFKSVKNCVINRKATRVLRC